MCLGLLGFGLDLLNLRLDGLNVGVELVIGVKRHEPVVSEVAVAGVLVNVLQQVAQNPLTRAAYLLGLHRGDGACQLGVLLLHGLQLVHDKLHFGTKLPPFLACSLVCGSSGYLRCAAPFLGCLLLLSTVLATYWLAVLQVVLLLVVGDSSPLCAVSARVPVALEKGFNCDFVNCGLNLILSLNLLQQVIYNSVELVVAHSRKLGIERF